MDSGVDDYRLLQLAAQGNEEALVSLMGRYKHDLFRCVYRYVGNDADAAAITEETFYKVYLNAGNFSPRGSVKSWIFTIGVNLAKDHLRRQKYRGVTLSLEAETHSGETRPSLGEIVAGTQRDPADDLVSTEILEQVQGEIRNLPEKLRFPFVFCILEDHSYDDCAEILRVNRKTVEMRIYRARKRLREKLAALL